MSYFGATGTLFWICGDILASHISKIRKIRLANPLSIYYVQLFDIIIRVKIDSKKYATIKKHWNLFLKRFLCHHFIYVDEEDFAFVDCNS